MMTYFLPSHTTNYTRSLWLSLQYRPCPQCICSVSRGIRNRACSISRGVEGSNSYHELSALRCRLRVLALLLLALQLGCPANVRNSSKHVKSRH